MTRDDLTPRLLPILACAALVLGAVASTATATEPCDDFGECKVLIEINSSDGDIGFHFLMDADDLLAASMRDANGKLIFQDRAHNALAEQKLTETFAESAEPLCWDDPEEEDELIVTLEEFLERWAAGTYVVEALAEEDGHAIGLMGETELTYELPAAPTSIQFDETTGVITWDTGSDLGQCADYARLTGLVNQGILPTHPEDVTVDSWEVVLVPDVDDGDPLGALEFKIRLPGDPAEFDPTVGVTVPADYLASLPDDTPAKIEVGAIGGEDNATFTEVDGFCINEVEGCDEEED